MSGILSGTQGNIDSKSGGGNNVGNSDDLAQIVVECIAGALVLTDLDQNILWCNSHLSRWISGKNGGKDSPAGQKPVGQKFFAVLDYPEMLGPDFLPFSKVKRTGLPTVTTLKMNVDSSTPLFLQMSTSPVFGEDNKVIRYVVFLHDVTTRTIREEKWMMLHESGKELADLSKKDILRLSPKERTNLLRAKIAKYIREILKYDFVEIRVRSEKNPLVLESLFAFGISDESQKRPLHVSQDGNGVTGWVAYHGKSYIMEDSNDDPFFIEGVAGARSSITVPLLYHGDVIGTFNVESLRPNNFDESDLLLIETFANDVAMAIHTLGLLSVEQKESAFRSIEKVFTDSISPLNLILNETTCLPLDGIQNETTNINDIVASFTRVREYAREIQSAFQGHIASLTPDLRQELSATDCSNYPMLRDKRILMVDGDETIGKELSRLLFYYGCTVEATTSGFSALKMVEATQYDAFLSDIKLSDMSAFSFFKKVRCVYCKRLHDRPLDTICEPPEQDVNCPMTIAPFVPFIFMRSFGYDSGHVTVRAAEAGLPKAIFKPFILPQLLDSLKNTITKAEKENIK